MILLFQLFLVPLLATQAQETPPSSSQCCDDLAASFAVDDQLLVPSSSANYLQESTAYWSATNHLSPACIVLPSSTADVSTALQILTASRCPFAVRGGGHSPNPGFASSPSVLISTSRMASVRYDDVTRLAHVGPGAVWGDVYSALEPAGRAAVGGKLSSVGVGGLVLGGGVSWFSGARGLACDNVAAFEVVLANSSVVFASSQENADLFWALKGGSGNFGVVTDFVLRTHPQGAVWAGRILYLVPQQVGDVLEAFGRFVEAEDEKAAIIVTATSALWDGVDIAIASIFYDEPRIDTPEIFEEFLEMDMVRVGVPGPTTLVRFALFNDFGGVEDGGRQLYRTGTIINDQETIDFIHAVCKEEFDAVDGLSGAISTLAFQPIPGNIKAYGEARGGNALTSGLGDGVPKIWWLITIRWNFESDDEKFYDMARRLTGRVEEWQSQRGQSEEFRYLNEAMFDQDVFDGYDDAVVSRLVKVRDDVDPDGILRELMGGFKLPEYRTKKMYITQCFNFLIETLDLRVDEKKDTRRIG